VRDCVIAESERKSDENREKEKNKETCQCDKTQERPCLAFS